MTDGAKLRAWWFHRQGLDGRLKRKTATQILAETGWSRSVGGVGPYLTLFSRGRIGREAADAAVAELEIHELPSARGCTYVVPHSDFALALSAALASAGSDLRNAYKLGVTNAEIHKLCGAVLRALEGGPLEPEEIRKATGNTSRSLGEAGKKKGLTTTLPLAIGKLQATGDIRRVSLNGRLDQQRYRYALWKPNPLRDSSMTPGEVATKLARHYFHWIGPATLSEFQWFSGLGVKAAKEATAPLGLESLDSDDSLLILPEDHEQLKRFQAPQDPQYALVSSLDGLSLLRRSLKSLVDPRDFDRKVFTEKSYAAAGTLPDLPSHGIFDRGRLVGLWDYDTETQTIAWTAFVPKSKDLVAAVQETERFVRDELGDARSFSLDSPKSRAPRVKALRSAG